MEGEFSIYDGGTGEEVWRGIFESGYPVDQVQYPDGVTPGEVLDSLIFIDKGSEPWQWFGGQ